MPHDTHKRKNNGLKVDDVGIENKRPKKHIALHGLTTSSNSTKFAQKIVSIQPASREQKRGVLGLRSSSEPRRFDESSSLSTTSGHEIVIREETLDGDTSCSSQEVDFLLENSTGFYSGKGDVSTSSSDVSSHAMETSPFHLSCDENLLEEESTNPDRPLSAIQYHRFDSDIIMTERSTVRKTLLMSLEINTNTDLIFDILPEEVIVSIFRYLPLLSREKVNQVCKRWNFICKQFELLHIFPTDIYGMMVRNMRKHAKTMLNYFKSRIHLELNAEMRAVLVDWLIEVCEEFEMDAETLFLTVNYLDRYLSAIGVAIPRHRLQLLGMTSLLIASKYEEMEIPTISDLIYLSDNSYTREEVTEMEGNVLNVLKFDITVFTVKRFIEFYVHLLFEEVSVIQKSHKMEVSDIAHYFAELSLLNYELAISSPDLLASAIVSIALNSCGFTAWPQTLKLEAHFAHRDLEFPISTLLQMHSSAIHSRLRSISNKRRYEPFVSRNLPEMIYV